MSPTEIDMPLPVAPMTGSLVEVSHLGLLCPAWSVVPCGDGGEHGRSEEMCSLHDDDDDDVWNDSQPVLLLVCFKEEAESLRLLLRR